MNHVTRLQLLFVTGRLTLTMDLKSHILFNYKSWGCRLVRPKQALWPITARFRLGGRIPVKLLAFVLVHPSMHAFVLFQAAALGGQTAHTYEELLYVRTTLGVSHYNNYVFCSWSGQISSFYIFTSNQCSVLQRCCLVNQLLNCVHMTIQLKNLCLLFSMKTLSCLWSSYNVKYSSSITI